jgi:hypothetical protein
MDISPKNNNGTIINKQMNKNYDNPKNFFKESSEELWRDIVNGNNPPSLFCFNTSEQAAGNQQFHEEQKNVVILLDRELDYYPDIYDSQSESKNLKASSLL